MFPNVQMHSLRSGWHRRVSPPSSTLPDCGEVSARVLRWRWKSLRKSRSNSSRGDGGSRERRRKEVVRLDRKMHQEKAADGMFPFTFS